MKRIKLSPFKREICSNPECRRLGLIANRTRMLCIRCNRERLNLTKTKKTYSPIQRLSEKGKETAVEDNRFFRQIWKERPHRSEVSGEPLGDKFKAIFCSHLLSKKAYPKFRHKKENIILKTEEEHFTWEFAKHKIKDNPMWKPMFELEQRLKEKYHRR